LPSQNAGALSVSRHPPVGFEDRPGDDHRLRLVYVTRGLAREPVELFAGITAVAAPA
jgi:hypothetical protein